jgi:transcriptional regulator with XRE-family HTH domain
MELRNANDYAKKLRALRKSRFIKQAVMTEILGLKSQQQYSDLESGKKQFTGELVIKICNFFSVSLLGFIKINAVDRSLNGLVGKDEMAILESDGNSELKLLVYKKLFLETKLENIELHMKLLQGIRESQSLHESLKPVFVII